MTPIPQTAISVLAAAALAICGPAWLARNISPSATFFNQAVSLIGWAALLALMLRESPVAIGAAWRRTTPVASALFLMLLATGLSNVFQRLPGSLAWSGVGLLGAAVLTVIVTALASRRPIGEVAFHSIFAALLIAGAFSVLIALVQVFAPNIADGEWIARSATAGRAGGNLRQPNHLSSLLLCSIAALVWLHETRVERGTTPVPPALRGAAAALMVALLFGVVLTVSRTGTVCVVLLALWGVLDRQLSRFSRLMLWLAPLVYIVCWIGMSEWNATAFAGGGQLHKSDPSSSRFGIWANTIELIKQNPWFGVGWGEFNFAWTLTPFPGRPVAFFDHTHNLPLQLLVELGIPLGTLVLALLAWALWKAFSACRTTPEPQSRMVRTAFVIVLMMAVHSMLEYPLWYAYFLLPTAFMFGICLGHAGPPDEEPAVPSSPWWRRGLIAASLVLMLGTAYSVYDYTKVTVIFSAEEDTPLSYRIAEGQKSTFFAHHADYAAATVAEHPSSAMKSFQRAPHYLLDTRLMLAWAKAYAERGDVERARYIADRLREFHNADADEFFAECDAAKRTPSQPLPFQCTPATRQFTYEDFKLRSN